VQVRSGVEVQLHVRDRPPAVVVGDHVREVADPHVVGDDREIDAPEPPARDLEIADRGGERAAWVEAVVDQCPLALEAADQAGSAGRVRGIDLSGQSPAPAQIDVHP
jgi:hypothetical protein